MIAGYFVNLPVNFVRGIAGFLYIWYIQSSKDFWNKEIIFLKQVERDIGIKINLKLIAEPIYSDYSYLGRVIGPIFRLARVLVGVAIMSISIITIFFIYLIWIIFPLLTIIMVISNLLYIF